MNNNILLVSIICIFIFSMYAITLVFLFNPNKFRPKFKRKIKTDLQEEEVTVSIDAKEKEN